MNPSTRKIDRIAAVGVPFKRYRFGEDPAAYFARIEAQVENLKRTGTTHVLVNEAPCALPRILDPRNSYMQFFEYGYCLDQFVTVSYNRDIYYEKVKALNRELLQAHAALAKTHGFRCYIMCLEPTFMQEAMFERYPHWRGPRVDNPDCSHRPIFAPCVHLPEVQDYYRQLIKGMLELVPEIDEIHIPTNDTGGGFCYCEGLYAGPNGPRHCRHISAGQHAREFAQALLEGGRAVNPEFRVIMTSGLYPKEKQILINGAPEGICTSVYGAFAWQGGLEDYWGTMAVGPKVFTDPQLRQETREWAYADMRARFKPLLENKIPAYAAYTPLYYRYDDPRPFETHQIITSIMEMGAQNLIGGAPGGRYSINGAVMRRAFENGKEDTETVVRGIAREWLGANGPIDTLIAAWRLTNRASCGQPILPHAGHAIWSQNWLINMPLVPDEDKLTPQDLGYFLRVTELDEQKLVSNTGGVWNFFNSSQDDVDGNIRQYEKATLPDYEQALRLLTEAAAAPGLSPTARQCLADQIAIVTTVLNAHRFVCLWLQAARHRLGHLTPPAGAPALTEIIDQMLTVPPPRNANCLVPEDAPNRPPEEQDRCRRELMCRHRNDPVKRMDMRHIPMRAYPGVQAWPGAHKG